MGKEKEIERGKKKKKISIHLRNIRTKTGTEGLKKNKRDKTHMMGAVSPNDHQK
jgi:hypothetical protein